MLFTLISLAALPAQVRSMPSEFGEIGGKSVFVGSTAATGDELWVTDGTARGTRLLKDLCPGPCSAVSYARFGRCGAFLCFSENSPSGRALWRTDGTAEGTQRVRAGLDVLISPHNWFERDGTALFRASAREGEWQLWRTDGSPEGTRQVTSCEKAAPKCTRGVGNVASFGNALLLAADEPGAGMELAVFRDGVLSRIKDIAAGARPSKPSQFRTVGETVYFTANDGLHGEELWRTDGTADGTRQVADLRPGKEGSSPGSFVVLASGRMIFTAADGLPREDGHGRQLWVLESKGPRMLQAIGTGMAPKFPEHLTLLGEDVFFAVDDGVTGKELWKSDGSHEGTVRVSDLCKGHCGAYPRGLVSSSEALFFTAEDERDVTSLWRLPRGSDSPSAVMKFPHAGSPRPRLMRAEPILDGVLVETALDERWLLMPPGWRATRLTSKRALDLALRLRKRKP